MKLRQFTIRTLFLAATGAALFCAGYLVGFDNGRNARFEDLITLIRDTFVPSSDWVTNGTIDQPDGGSSVVVSDDSLIVDPFVTNSSDGTDSDPFTTVQP